MDTTSPDQLARLPPKILAWLQRHAEISHQRAIAAVRSILDIAVISVDHGLPSKQQRLLLEHADDELANAQNWAELAANARFCREHPELARQLAGDEDAGSSSHGEHSTAPLKTRPTNRAKVVRRRE